MFIYQAQSTENPEGPIPQFQTPSTTNSNPKNFIQEPKLKTPTPESAIKEKKKDELIIKRMPVTLGKKCSMSYCNFALIKRWCYDLGTFYTYKPSSLCYT